MTLSQNLRIMPYVVTTGAEHMKMDEWLLNQANSDGITTLRFYTWAPSAISLGYHQHQIPDHWQELTKQLGMDIVRRPSGGRAVLHKGDLTYAVITPSPNLPRPDVYKSICQFLIDGMAELGIELDYGAPKRSYHNPSCFATATNADLVTADGFKVIGSAQVYRHHSVLQHGSIQITPDRQLLQQLFNQEAPVAELRGLINSKYSKYSDRDLIALIIETLTKSASGELCVVY